MNAFSIRLERDLLSGTRRACEDEDVRVVIFAGAGRAFSGGWDLGETDLTDAEHHPLSGRAGPHKWLEVIRTLRRADKLFLAAVHGYAARHGPSRASPATSSSAPAPRRFSSPQHRS